MLKVGDILWGEAETYIGGNCELTMFFLKLTGAPWKRINIRKCAIMWNIWEMCFNVIQCPLEKNQCMKMCCNAKSLTKSLLLSDSMLLQQQLVVIVIRMIKVMMIWQNFFCPQRLRAEESIKIVTLLLLTMVSTNVNIVCQEDLSVWVDPVKHLFTILFKHPQLKALVKLVLLQLPQLKWCSVRNSFISICGSMNSKFERLPSS